jgi:RND family efflux transporter MFP subunit
LLALLLGAGAAAAETPATSGDVILKIDERGIRAAGISTLVIERVRGGTDLVLPGTVVIPQTQIRVVAAPAGGLVEVMLVSADEAVTARQPIAQLRSPAVVEAQRQFLGALADEALSADRLRRTQLLVEGRAIPERELQVVQTEATQAKLRVDERRQLLGLMEFSDADVDALRTTRKILPTITVTSPINGTVVTRHSSPGERVEAAAPLFTIADLDPLWVNVQVPAARLGNISIGQRITIGAYEAKGRIIRIGRTVDANTQSAIAVAEVDSAGGSVRPGLAVTVTVHIDGGDSGQWSMPTASVVRHNDRSWVFLRTPDGFRARPVQIITESVREVVVRAEFEAGDQIVIRGVLSLLSALAAANRE